MMGSASGMIWRWGVATSLVLIISIAQAAADVTTERSSSILIFPKILSDSVGLQTGGPVDTIIQISNTSNSMVFAHCFYVNAALQDGLPQCQEVDFDIWLTKQQPTQWLVSTGRRVDPTSKTCTKTVRDCGGAGFDPGFIPPVPDPFTGELKCIEVDSIGGAPLNGNHLKGEATIVTPAGDASKYNAIGVMGLNTATNYNNSDLTLCLGGGVSDACPNGAEYNACPQTVMLDHFAENATDPVIEGLGDGPSKVTTELTVVPCSDDFENQYPGQVTIVFQMTNEFEELFSTSTTVTCWGNFKLNRIGLGSNSRVFDVGNLGTRFVQTRMFPAADDQSGFVGIAEEFHQRPSVSLSSRAALNLHGEGERVQSDIIILPAGAQ